jgi:hypothetical protein
LEELAEDKVDMKEKDVEEEIAKEQDMIADLKEVVKKSGKSKEKMI